MAKMKKSIKAIIISICAAIVLAGSIVGVVLATTNKGKGGSGSPAVGGGNTPVSPGGTNPPAVVYELTDSQKELVNLINSSAPKAEVAGEFNYDEFFYEDRSQIDVTKIKKVKDGYLIYDNSPVVEKTALIRIEETDKVYYKDVFDILNLTGNVVYKEFLNFVGDYLSVKYVIDEGSQLNIVLDVYDFSNPKAPVLEKSMMVENVENFATSESSVTLQENFYYFISHPNNSNYKVEVYSYESDEPLVSKSATYSAVSIINDFDNLMYFNNNNLFTFVYFDGEEFNVFEKDLTNAVGRKVCNDLVVVEYTTDNVNYTYQILDLETQELTDFDLNEGYKKAKFTDFESTYLKVYQEKDENTKLFTYYDYDFNKIIEYETDTEVGDILYSEGGKLLTYSGVIGVEKTITASYLTRFASDAFEYKIASLENVNSNGGVFVVSNEDSSQTFMKMNGEIVFEETFSEICSYGNGYYVAYNPGQYYLIDVKSGEILEIETENFYNENYFIMNNGGYFIVENPDEVTYSVFDYSGKLVSGIVSNVDYKKFQNQTALILNQSDGTILSFVVDRDIPIEDVDLNSVKVSSKDDFDYTQTYELYSDEYMTVELYFTCPDSTPDYSRWYYNSDSTNYADYHANVWLKQSNYTAAVKILLVFGYYIKEGRICLTPKGDGNLDFNFSHTGKITKLSSGETNSRVGDYTITPKRSWQTWEGFGGYLLEYHIELQTDDERTINKFIEGYPRIRPEVHANPGISRLPAVVEYNYNNGSAGTYAPTTVYFGSTTTISNPTRTGYTFNNWIITTPEVGYTKQRDEGTCPLYTSSGTSYTFYPQLGCKRGSLTSSPTTWNITYTFSANWSENSYTISYVLDGGSHGTNHPTSAKYTTTITVSNPTRVGHTFTGWDIYLDGDPNDTLIKSAQMGTSYSKLASANGAKVIFTATWRLNNYTIKFTNLVANQSFTVTKNNNATETGSFLDGKKEVCSLTANSSGEVTTAMRFGYAGSGSTYEAKIEYPQYTGYTFAGWNISGMCSCTATSHAHYWGGDSHFGTTDGDGYVTAKTGYLNLTCVDGATVTMGANWTKNTYTIQYELNGGSTSTDGPASATYDAADPFNVVNPTRIGYTFAGWNITGLTDKGAFNENVKHYSGTSKTNVAEFTGATKNGTTHTWFKNLATGGTVTFSAQWTAHVYNISYDLVGGTHGTYHPDSQAVAVTGGANDFSVSNPTKTGYIFTGWNITNMCDQMTHWIGGTSYTATSVSGVMADRNYINLSSIDGATVYFTATWTPISYNITYSYASGILESGKNNPTSTSYDQTITVNTPIRHGYNFAGWTIANSSAYTSTTGTANYPNNRTDDFINMTATNGATITFTATWTAVTYRVTFYHDSSNHDDGTATYSYDATPFTKEHPTKMGYTFVSWTITYCTNCSNATWPDCNHVVGSTTSEGTEYLNVTATSFKNLACIQGTDVTFTANWSVNSYNVQLSGAYGANLEMSSVPFDSWFYVDAPTDHPVGYHFTGWSVTSMIDKDANTNETVTHYHDTEKTSGTHESATGTTLTIANTASRYYFKNLHSTNGATVTITPTWDANNYTVTFDLNNPNWVTSDISSQATIDAIYDVAFTVANPTKAGYTFAGWELNELSDDCDHYRGTTNATSTKFSSNGGKYDAGQTLVKDTYFKNFRSDTGAALMKAIWQVNSYTITYHVLPKTFDATAFAASEIHTKINVVSKLTVTITQQVTYDASYMALKPHTDIEINFEMPVGLRFVLWAIPSDGVTVNSNTSVGKYEPAGSETVVSALGDSINAGEQRIYGPGKLAADYTDWQYYSKDMHFYAVYELAGINLRYYVPTTAAGSNFLQNYKNVENISGLTHLNERVKYTDIITFADNVNIPNYENFMGWMISATYDSDGQLTKDSLSRYTYQSTTYAAYRGFSACWGFTNVDAYSYEDPTYFLYAVYDDEYSGDFGCLEFAYDSGAQSYSVKCIGNDAIPSDGHVKIPSHFDNGSTGFKPVTSVQHSAFRFFTNLKSIYMPDTITYIGDYAFQDTNLTNAAVPSKLEILCGRTYSGTDITEFTAPETLKEIRSGNAFDSCTSLKTVVLNEGLTLIGGATFQGCTALETVNIPSTVVEMGNRVFNGCSKITAINIPYGVTEIGDKAFSACTSLASVTFSPNSALMTIGEEAFSTCTALTSISIPNSVTLMKMGVFYGCSGLVSVTMPDKLTELAGGYTFYNCSSLTSIVIPQGLTVINTKTFENCVSLASIEIYEGITQIAAYAFSNCSSLTSITIPDTVTWIGPAAFAACGSLKTLKTPFASSYAGDSRVIGYLFGTEDSSLHSTYVPTSLETVIVTKATNVGANAFANIASLKSLTLPNTVTSIGANILSGCTALEYLSVPFIGTSKEDTTNNYIGYWLNLSVKTADLGTFVPALNTVHFTNAKYIGDYVLYRADAITTLTVNEGVESIGSYAFAYLENLVNFDVPTTVTTLGESAFASCKKLRTLGLNEGLTTLGNAVFDSCYLLNNITIPSTVTSIPANAFWRCSSLSNLTLLDGLTSIGGRAFIYCSALTTLTMPKTLTSIGLNAFEECTGLVTVVLNDGLTSIGEYAFLNCTSLKNINLPSTLTFMGHSAIRSTAIEAITVPASLTSSGISILAENRSLKSVYLTEGLTFIPEEMFAFCSALETIYIPSTVTTIGVETFYDCTSLKHIEVAGNVSIIPTSFAYGCTALKEVLFKGHPTEIQNTAFYGCSSLDYVYYGGTVDEYNAMTILPVGNDDFKTATKYYNYDHMTFTYTGNSYSIKGGNGSVSGLLEIPATFDDGVHGRYNVTKIEQAAFSSNRDITGVVLHEGLLEIEDTAFSQCTKMETINLPSTLTKLGDYVFYNANALTSLHIPAGVTVIPESFVRESNALKTITFASSSTLTKIGDNAFYNCESLENFALPTSLKYIGIRAFYKTTALLGEVILPEGLEYMGMEAFAYSTLQKVVLPSTLEVVEGEVFSACPNLSNIFIPRGVKTIVADVADNGWIMSSGPNYNMMIFTEYEEPQAGWGKYWQYSAGTVKAWVFYGYKKAPSVIITSNSTGLYQDDNGVIKTKTDSSVIDYFFKALNDYVNIRFDYQVMDASWYFYKHSITYYNLKVCSKSNSPEHFNVLIAPGEEFNIWRHTDYTSGECNFTNFGFDAIESATTDYGFRQVQYIEGTTYVYNGANSTYELVSGNKNVSHSSAEFKIYANDAVEVSFKYIVSSEAAYDRFLVYHNNDIVLDASGENTTSYAAPGYFNIFINKGDTLKLVYEKDWGADRGTDTTTILNLQIKKQVLFVDDSVINNFSTPELSDDFVAEQYTSIHYSSYVQSFMYISKNYEVSSSYPYDYIEWWFQIRINYTDSTNPNAIRFMLHTTADAAAGTHNGAIAVFMIPAQPTLEGLQPVYDLLIRTPYDPNNRNYMFCLEPGSVMSAGSEIYFDIACIYDSTRYYKSSVTRDSLSCWEMNYLYYHTQSYGYGNFTMSYVRDDDSSQELTDYHRTQLYDNSKVRISGKSGTFTSSGFNYATPFESHIPFIYTVNNAFTYGQVTAQFLNSSGAVVETIKLFGEVGTHALHFNTMRGGQNNLYKLKLNFSTSSTVSIDIGFAGGVVYTERVEGGIYFYDMIGAYTRDNTWISTQNYLKIGGTKTGDVVIGDYYQGSYNHEENDANLYISNHKSNSMYADEAAEFTRLDYSGFYMLSQTEGFMGSIYQNFEVKRMDAVISFRMRFATSGSYLNNAYIAVYNLNTDSYVAKYDIANSETYVQTFTFVIHNVGSTYRLEINFGNAGGMGAEISLAFACVYEYGTDNGRRKWSSIKNAYPWLSEPTAYNKSTVISNFYENVNITPYNSLSSGGNGGGVLMDNDASYSVTAPYDMVLSFEYYYYYGTQGDLGFYKNGALVSQPSDYFSWQKYQVSLNKGDTFTIMYYNSYDIAGTISRDYAPYFRNFKYTKNYGFVKNGSQYESTNVGLDASESVITFNVLSSQTFSFDYEISAEYGVDRIEVYVDGTFAFSSYGKTSGSFSQTVYNGSVVTVKYIKDKNISEGTDKCILKNVSGF